MLTCLISDAVAQDNSLTVATWSGFHANAYEAAVFRPFSRETGIAIRIHAHDDDLRTVSESLSQASSRWDVVELARADLTTNCGDGQLARIDHEQVLGVGAVDDFLPGTLHPCGVASLIWSQAIAYDATLFKDGRPRTLSDFFDLETFPGSRGVYDGAEGTLEIALMADGVAPAEVYATLRRGGGIERALAKLDTMRSSLLFWRFANEAEALLDGGDVTMTTAFVGRLLRPRQGARRPTGIMWTNQLVRATFWAIPARVTDPVDAYRLIAFATDPERQAQLAARLWFGPVRRAGLAAVPQNIRDNMPTARRNFHDALPVDTGYWSEFGAEAEAKFRAWRQR